MGAQPPASCAIRPDGNTTARLRKQTGGFAFGNPDSGAARYLPLPPFTAAKFSFGNLALTMIGVWLEA
jgi:hypothetical protein